MEVAKVAQHWQIGNDRNVYDPIRLILLDSWAPLVATQPAY